MSGSDRPVPVAFFRLAGASLALALCAGIWGIHLVAWSDAGDSLFVFTKLRPLHVTFAIAWIFMAAR